jgi:hypothetical protein
MRTNTRITPSAARCLQPRRCSRLLPPASVAAARCSAAVLPLRAPSTPLPRRSPPNNCVRIARLCASTRVRTAMAAASTRRARPVLSPRHCCAFSLCAAWPIPSHPRRPPPMPVLCAGVPSPRCHAAPYLFRPTFHMQLPPLFASPASTPTSSPHVRPFSPRAMHVTPAPTLPLPLFHTPVLSHHSAAPSLHARSAPHAAAARPFSTCTRLWRIHRHHLV